MATMNEMCCMCVDHNAVPHRWHLHNFMQTLMCVVLSVQRNKGIEANYICFEALEASVNSVDTSDKNVQSASRNAEVDETLRDREMARNV